jgi:hypothetical protein
MIYDIVLLLFAIGILFNRIKLHTLANAILPELYFTTMYIYSINSWYNIPNKSHFTFFLTSTTT